MSRSARAPQCWAAPGRREIVRTVCRTRRANPIQPCTSCMFYCHAVPARFRGEFGDQERDDLSADYRHKDDQRAQGTGRGENARVVVERKDAEKTDVMNETDEV